MQENVGGAELVVRSLAGPALLLAALTVLGARQGKPAGLGSTRLGRHGDRDRADQDVLGQRPRRPRTAH